MDRMDNGWVEVGTDTAREMMPERTVGVFPEGLADRLAEAAGGALVEAFRHDAARMWSGMYDSMDHEAVTQGTANHIYLSTGPLSLEALASDSGPVFARSRVAFGPSPDLDYLTGPLYDERHYVCDGPDGLARLAACLAEQTRKQKT
jgi:hypothetical protein